MFQEILFVHISSSCIFICINNCYKLTNDKLFLSYAHKINCFAVQGPPGGGVVVQCICDAACYTGSCIAMSHAAYSLTMQHLPQNSAITKAAIPLPKLNREAMKFLRNYIWASCWGGGGGGELRSKYGWCLGAGAEFITAGWDILVAGSFFLNM